MTYFGIAQIMAASNVKLNSPFYPLIRVAFERIDEFAGFFSVFLIE